MGEAIMHLADAKKNPTSEISLDKTHPNPCHQKKISGSNKPARGKHSMSAEKD